MNIENEIIKILFFFWNNDSANEDNEKDLSFVLIDWFNWFTNDGNPEINESKK